MSESAFIIKSVSYYYDLRNEQDNKYSNIRIKYQRIRWAHTPSHIPHSFLFLGEYQMKITPVSTTLKVF